MKRAETMLKATRVKTLMVICQEVCVCAREVRFSTFVLERVFPGGYASGSGL